MNLVIIDDKANFYKITLGNQSPYFHSLFDCVFDVVADEPL